MNTLAGNAMTSNDATQPVGTALRIAPAFVATATGQFPGIETTIEAHYNPARGRYIPTTIVNRAISDDFDEDRLKRTATQAILQAAIPHCVSVLLDDTPGAEWTTIADLTATEGRIIPLWLAEAVVKRGVKDERWEVIEILYSSAALADSPPVQLIALELDVPERTAVDWIKKARAAGWLTGITSNIGRPVSG